MEAFQRNADRLEHTVQNKPAGIEVFENIADGDAVDQEREKQDSFVDAGPAYSFKTEDGCKQQCQAQLDDITAQPTVGIGAPAI